MKFVWKNYCKKYIETVDSFLDNEAIKYTSCDDGFNAFYSYWHNELGESNFWCKFILIENEPIAVISLAKALDNVFTIQEFIVSPNHFHADVEEWPDFYSHREDQSILTLLAIKHKLPSFRDCSDYGMMPYMYSSPDWSYCPKKYPNSTYPTIVLCSRKMNPLKYAIKYFVKRFFSTLGIYYTEKQVLQKRGITYENHNI